jgi:tRNA G46 methylase TrmB
MVDLVKKAGELRTEFTNAIEAKNVTMEQISDELSLLANATLEYLKITFPHPDKAPSHEERRVMISTALEHIEENLVTLAIKYDIQEERVRPIVRDIRNILTPILTTCGEYL